MVVLKSLDSHCSQCEEFLAIIAKDRLTCIIDGTEVVRVREKWKCLNGHITLKMYGEQPKIVVN